jgi:hypothetical protein
MPDPEMATEPYLRLVRAGLYIRATLGRGPEPTEPSIDAIVAAQLIRSFAPLRCRRSDYDRVGDAATHQTCLKQLILAAEDLDLRGGE